MPKKNDSSKTAVLVVFNENNQGPIVLYELLTKNGYPCKFVYYFNDSAANRLALRNFIQSCDAMLTGFSFASQSAETAFGLAAYLRQECQGIPLIFGGVHPTVDPVSCVDHCDAVCVGEGEKTLLEIADKLGKGEDYRSSGNLVYQKDGRIIRTAVNPLIVDMDALPVRRPYTEDHVVIKRGRVVTVDRGQYFEILPSSRTCYTQIFSRGCPYSCSYCCNSKFHGIYQNWPKIRSMSVDATINEICVNIEYNPSIIKVFIIDDCFLAHDTVWLQDFAVKWREKVNKELSFFTIPEYITREKLEILKSINTCYCSVGLQSGSRKINELYNRKFSPETFLRACGLIRSLDMGLVVNLIFDNPWEKDDDVHETLKVLTRIEKPFYIMQYSLKIYPGTKLFEYCRDNNIKIPDFNKWFVNYNTIKAKDINRVLVLSQMLPSGIVFYLFRNHQKRAVKILLRVLYFLACIIMPFHALHVSGSKNMKHNVAIAMSHSRLALNWVKGLLGRANAPETLG